MIHFKEPQSPARYRIDGVDLYDIHELNRHGQMLQELALKDAEEKTKAAVKAERETCAAVADIALLGCERSIRDRVVNAIRARGEK